MTAAGDSRYLADVAWTTHGVAHIRAGDWGSLGFGQGWAIARDHLATIADQLVKVRGEWSRYHGVGPEDAYLASDFGYRMLDLAGRAHQYRDEQPAHIRELVTGYTAGYNAWLVEAQRDGALPEWCADAEWIAPVDELDFYTYFGDVSLLGSGRNLVGIIGRAVAPGRDGPAPASPVSALGAPTEASNGWAFGADSTASGHGVVMANPHFPWGGEARFWECHLTVPGELDAYGVCLLGAPGIQMGFNTNVAWAHTFSRGHRFTLARLDLVPGAPTRYLHGEDERAMTPTTYAVDCRTPDGDVAPVERTLWSSHHGPMVNLPLVGWSHETAYTYRDANIDNRAVFSQFLGMAQATDMDAFQAVFTDVGALPWVNTLAADRTGRAWYTDGSPTPNLSVSAQDRYRERVRDDLIAALLLENRVALLDGSEPDDDWVDEPGAKGPGLIPPDRLPALERSDFVVNANDSHWLANPAAPLEGYSPLHGFERVPQGLRTRQNVRTAARLAATGSVTVTAALEAVLSNDSLSAELLREAVVDRARTVGSVTVGDDSDDGDSGATRAVDLGAVAEVLAAWDGRVDLDSRGAFLWREFMAGFEPKYWIDAGPLFAHAFDPADPVATPSGLAPADSVAAAATDPVVTALVGAVTHLSAAGLSIDASVAEGQWVDRGGVRVAAHGGGEGDGVCNVLAPIGSLASHALEPGPERLAPVPGHTARTGLRIGGYRCTYGTSFLMAVELTDVGPVGVGLLAYGQSGDPRSPHHRDGTDAYVAKAPRPLLFHQADIEADPNLVRRTITG